MKDSYINKKQERQNRNEIINNYIFGMFFGLAITLIFTFRLFYTRLNRYSIINLLFIIYGLVCVLLVTINPRFKVVTKIRNFTTRIFNFLGESLLKLILVIIYFIFVVPIGLIFKKRLVIKNEETSFVDFQSSWNKKLSKYKFLKLFQLFSSDYFYMIPLLIILTILSILVFLITTSVFTPFIYTIF